MTKKELFEKVSSEVAEVLSSSKVAKKTQSELMSIIEAYLKPKSGGISTMNPSIEVDGVVYHYCRFHQMYEPAEDIVISKEKSKGYCKAAISKWNKQNATIKKLDSEASEALLEGDIDKAQELVKKSKELKDSLNLPSNFNYVEDWVNFSKANTEEAIAKIEAKYEALKAIK